MQVVSTPLRTNRSIARWRARVPASRFGPSLLREKSILEGPPCAGHFDQTPGTQRPRSADTEITEPERHAHSAPDALFGRATLRDDHDLRRALHYEERHHVFSSVVPTTDYAPRSGVIVTPRPEEIRQRSQRRGITHVPWPMQIREDEPRRVTI